MIFTMDVGNTNIKTALFERRGDAATTGGIYHQHLHAPRTNTA